jgi:hypothetical protein
MSRRMLTLYQDNAHWDKACGDVCPMKWRKSVGDAGVGEYKWYPLLEELKKKKKKKRVLVGWGADPPLFHPLEGDAVRFRLMSRCRNAACKNCQLYEERMTYFTP